MSIEKNEHELKGLKRQLVKLTNKKYAVLFNSNSGALHGALWGSGYGYGDSINIKGLNATELSFIKWLGIKNSPSEPNSEILSFQFDWDNLGTIDQLSENSKDAAVIKLNFTDLGFGPCAAIATDDIAVYKRAERLTIFGAFDLRTMWTQVEDEYNVQPGLQLNYRLSPLVGACTKLAIVRRNKE